MFCVELTDIQVDNKLSYWVQVRDTEYLKYSIQYCSKYTFSADLRSLVPLWQEQPLKS